MKNLWGNGQVFEVRDAGPVIVRLRARPGGPPIKFHRREVVEDDAARETLRELLASGLYDREV